MPNSKFIDVDAVNVKIGTARIGGVDYEVHQLTMQQYINLIVMSEQDENSKPGEYLKRTAQSLHEMIPSCPLEEIMKLTLEQINALMAWTRELARPAAEAETKNEETPQLPM